jgi:LytS/YehU family sensor histidine kinase
METSEPPLRVEIEIAASGPALAIRVSNTGRLMSAVPAEPAADRDGTGTGLRNVARRLELAYPGRHTFALAERDGWVHAEITLRPATKEVAP